MTTTINEERRRVAKLKLEAALYRQQAARLEREARARGWWTGRSVVLALAAWAALAFGIVIAVTPTHYQEPSVPTQPTYTPTPTPTYTMTPDETPATTPPPPPPGADETQCLPEYLPKSCVPLHGPIPGTTGWGERLV